MSNHALRLDPHDTEFPFIRSNAPSARPFAAEIGLVRRILTEGVVAHWLRSARFQSWGHSSLGSFRKIESSSQDVSKTRLTGCNSPSVTDWAAAGVADVSRVPATGDLRSGVATGSETLAEPEPRSLDESMASFGAFSLMSQ